MGAINEKSIGNGTHDNENAYIEPFHKWAISVLPLSRRNEYESEKKTIVDHLVLETPITISSFSIHETIFNIFKRVAVTEAAFERLFAHKLIHNRLRANLSSERLQDQLFECLDSIYYVLMILKLKYLKNK